jgi:hypothetical protein
MSTNPIFNKMNSEPPVNNSAAQGLSQLVEKQLLNEVPASDDWSLDIPVSYPLSATDKEELARIVGISRSFSGK